VFEIVRRLVPGLEGGPVSTRVDATEADRGDTVARGYRTSVRFSIVAARMVALLPVALVQIAPVYFDLAATLDVLEAKTAEAAAAGAKLVVFGESWLGGYPAWLDHCPEAALWDHPVTKRTYARHVEAAITLPGPEAERIAAVAAEHGVGVVVGAHERQTTGPGVGTLYNVLLAFHPDRGLSVHHRKLVPTFTERLIWGPGDGAGLRSMELSEARVGGLICWEHWMPLARQAMHEAGEDLHVAVWPWVHEAHQIASRSYAFEGRCHVLAVGSIMRRRDLPEGLAPDEGSPDELVLRGGSAVIGPDGRYLVEPVLDEERIVYAEVDTTRNVEERMTLDVTGHYARPDVFDLKIDRKRPSTEEADSPP